MTVVAIATAAVLSSCGDADHRAKGLPARSNILLITVDTLRADHLSSYGYPRPTSPTLDRLAGEGVRFERAIVPWPKTGPSFASIFTGTYPKDHRLIPRVGIPVPSSFRMLAEVLQSNGYATHAVVANGALGAEFNFHQGFTDYVESWKRPPIAEGADVTGAGQVTALAIEKAQELDPNEPFFFWVHYVDPHAPYSPPGEWADLFQNDEWFDTEETIPIDWEASDRHLGAVGRGSVLDDRDDLAFYTARYDAEIAYADAEIRILLDKMQGLGLMGRTLTVFTSDHGESLGEHQYYFDHGHYTYQTCLRVPLIFHYPSVLPAGVDQDPTEVMDLAPSLLQVAGVQLVDNVWMRAESLLPRLLGQRPRSVMRPLAFAQGQRDRVVLDRRFKYIGNWREGALYDLEEDPGEVVNVAAKNPLEYWWLRRALRKWLRAEPIELALDESDGNHETSGEIEDRTREQLRALGYLP